MRRAVPLIGCLVAISLAVAGCAPAAPAPQTAPPPLQLRPELPVRVDGILYEVRRTAGGVAVAGLAPDAPGQVDIARAAVRAICGADVVTQTATAPGQGRELLLYVADCPPLDG